MRTLTTEDLRSLIAASIRIYENGKNAPLNKGVKISKHSSFRNTESTGGGRAG